MKKTFYLFALSLGGLIVTPPVRALTFNVTYDSSVTSLANAVQVEAAFAFATATLENLYTNAATINLDVYWGATGPFSGGINLGASITQLTGNPSYAQLTNALRAARSSANDSNSVARLPPINPAAASVWWIPRAQAKVLHLLGLSATDPGNDGSVGFADNVSYTFDPTNRAVAGKYDFIAVAEHEITEMMGRIFGLDYQGGGFVPYDLFRFTNNAARSFDVNANNAYFSADNGVTSLKAFYTNVNMGDVQDWLSSSQADSFDAFSSSGKKGLLSAADLVTLDVLGYNMPPVKASVLTGTRLGGGAFRLSFTNVYSQNFTVLASTNATLTLSNWTVLGTPTESPFGQYQFTDSTATNQQRFYRVRSP